MELADDIRVAREAAGSGNLQGAAEHLMRLLRLHPDNAELYRELAQLRFAQGNKELGQNLLRRAALLEESLEYADIGVNVGSCAEAAPEAVDADAGYAIERNEELWASSREFCDAEHDPIAPRPEAGSVNDGATASEAAIDAPVASASARTTLTVGQQRDKSDKKDRASPRVVWRGTRRTRLPEEAKASRPLGEEPHAARPFIYPDDLARAPDLSGGEIAAQLDDSDDDELPVASDEEPIVDLPPDESWDDLEFPDEEDAGHEADGFDWTDVPVNFNEEVSEPVSTVAAELALASLPKRIDLWRYAEQKALELLRLVGRTDEGRHASNDWRVITRILLEGAAGARRPDISITVRARHLHRLLLEGIPLEDLAAAHACREVWIENPEFHIDLSGAAFGESWMRSESARGSLSWADALTVVEVFGATDKEELRAILFDLYERWKGYRRLQHTFSAFRAYVRYRLSDTDLLLDQVPELVFDEPDYSDYQERWLDDEVRAAYLRRELESLGLIPYFNRSSLDLPSASIEIHEE